MIYKDDMLHSTAEARTQDLGTRSPTLDSENGFPQGATPQTEIALSKSQDSENGFTRQWKPAEAHQNLNFKRLDSENGEPQEEEPTKVWPRPHDGGGAVLFHSMCMCSSALCARCTGHQEAEEGEQGERNGEGQEDR